THASGLIMDSGQNLSVMKAVALSGGTTHVAALDSAKIIRKDDKGNPVEVPVQLKKMFQGKAPDVDLVAEDILFIPTSAGKNAAPVHRDEGQIGRAHVTLGNGNVIFHPDFDADFHGSVKRAIHRGPQNKQVANMHGSKKIQMVS